MVPSVAINGTILPFVTSNPFTHPIKMPKISASIIDITNPKDWVPITIAADIAMTEPTDISIPPDIKTIAWPITIGASIDICLDILVKVKRLKKDDPNMKVKKVTVSINKNNGVFLRNFLKVATKVFMI
jgi:hypothetical protein